MSMTADDLKTVDEKGAAEILGAQVKTLQSWRWGKRGPKYLKVGRLVRYRLSDLAEYMERQTIRHEEA